jgi:hypothetical protein
MVLGSECSHAPQNGVGVTTFDAVAMCSMPACFKTTIIAMRIIRTTLTFDIGRLAANRALDDAKGL